MLFAILLACLGEPASEDSGDSGENDTGELDPLLALDPAELPRADSPCREPEVVSVDWVVDGDTAWVMGEGGSEKVRFTGIDAPETYEEADCWGEEASAFVKQELQGKYVWMTFDEECQDHYERTLAYLHTGTDTEDFFQRRLLREGWVTAYTVPPNDSFEDLFAQDEQVARQAGEGLWSACR
jgi:micrococcal nuclease